jgi:hypothetical protein
MGRAATLRLAFFDRGATLGAEVRSCRRNKRSGALDATRPKENHRPRRPANSCARRFDTSEKASTGPDPRSRRSRLGSRRLGAPAWICHRPRPARLRSARAVAPNAPTKRAVHLGRNLRHAGGRGRRSEPSSAKGARRRRARRSRNKLVRPRRAEAHRNGRRPRRKPRGRKEQLGDRRRRARPLVRAPRTEERKSGEPPG